MNVNLTDADDLLRAAVAVEVVFTEDHLIGVAASVCAGKWAGCKRANDISSVNVENTGEAKQPEALLLPVHTVSSSQNPTGLNQAATTSVVPSAAGFVLKRDLNQERREVYATSIQ